MAWISVLNCTRFGISFYLNCQKDVETVVDSLKKVDILVLVETESHDRHSTRSKPEIGVPTVSYLRNSGFFKITIHVKKASATMDATDAWV